MIFVVGGLGAGKRRFVEEQLGYSPEQMSSVLEDRTPVLLSLEELEPLPGAEELLEREVVVCREVGCGVIPLDGGERARREAVGRLCCQLAEGAHAVYRLTCGIPMRLK